MVDVAAAAANSALFDGIRPEDRSAMLTCLGAQTKTVRKGEFLVLAQDEVRYIGVVLSGEIHMIHEDRWGDKAVLAVIKEGGLFGETFVCATILQACPFHHRLIENMLHLIAAKNAQLMEKLEIVSKKTLRKKLLTYFSFQSEKAGSPTFTIPVTRSQLADYLCADRTAVAREMSRMKEEGLIDVNQQTVTLN